ncbi:MAG: zinc ribbon domain-containing protein [Planctomycetota bacterium]|jgi:phage FluMu protein Com
MISFSCKHCGQKIRVPEAGAGRKGKCPKCKNIVVIPKVKDTTEVASLVEPIESKIVPQATILNPSAFEDGPKETSTGGEAAGGSLGMLASMLGSGAGYGVQEEKPTRKLPWIIDIFLYPISKAGLTTMGIIIGVPIAITLVMLLFGVMALAYPPIFVFVVFFGMIGGLIRIIISLFTYWYLCECIRDSADGSIRAPETMATTPGIGEIFWQFMKLVGCFIFFWAPLVGYVYTSGAAQLFFSPGSEPLESGFSPFIAILLLAYAVLFYPMGLLSMVLFDSLEGLNPILVIGSILSTFFQYCGLILLFFAIGALSILSVTFLPQLWFLRFFSNVTLLYMAMVYAHLLGRFYWKYQEKLNWEV